MAKLMISMPEEMVAKIEYLAKRESRSKSELLREAVRCYEQMQEGRRGMTLEEAKKLSEETDELAERIGRSVGSWDTTAAIRKLRDSR